MLRVSLLLIFFSVLSACSSNSDVELKNRQDSIAYSLGISWGKQFMKDSTMYNLDLIKAGMYDAMYGDTTKLSEQEVMNIMRAVQMEMRQKFEARKNEESEKNRQAGEAFLAENRTKEGVITTPSGLQYKIINPGSGKAPTAESNVSVKYKGMLIDGTVFDESKEGPVSFDLKNLIPGWKEGIPLIKEGGKILLYIPANLAYGNQQRGNLIKPGSTLIFEIELIKVNS